MIEQNSQDSTSIPSSEDQLSEEDNAPVLGLSRSPSHLLYLAKQRSDEVMAAQLANIGITPRQFTFMYAIYVTPGLNQKNLSEVTGSDRSTVAELVNRLAERGLLDRVRSPADARCTNLQLTKEGSRNVKLALERAASADQHLLDMIGAERQDAFLDTLTQVASAPIVD